MAGQKWISLPDIYPTLGKGCNVIVSSVDVFGGYVYIPREEG